MNYEGKSGPISISVVIPSYRPNKDLFNCLDSVMQQDINVPYEVIVVDSSPEDMSEEINKSFPSVQFFHLKQRALPGKARSFGAEKAKGDIVFFTDTDCITDRKWMRKLWDIHQTGYNIAGGSVANGTPKSIFGTSEYLVEFNEMNPWAKAGEVMALPSCNLSVNKTVFEKVGYFPNFLKGEDTSFCGNAIASGERIYFNPEARITHMNRTSFIHFIRNQVSLGEGAKETRRRIKRPGGFLLKYPFLIPFIPFYRTLVIGKRFIFSSRKLFVNYLLLYPIILLGLLAYTYGFIRGPRIGG